MSEETSSFKEKLQDAYEYVVPVANTVILTGCAVILAIGAYQAINSLGAHTEDLASGFIGGLGEATAALVD